MKLLLLILIYFCSLSVSAQSIDSAVNSIVSGVVKVEISRLETTLDSIVIKHAVSNSSATIFIDTLKLPVNTQGIFTLVLQTSNVNDIGTAEKVVTVKNIKGVYSIAFDTNTRSYLSQPGVAKIAWSVAQSVGSPPTIRFAGLANQTIKITITKTVKVTAL
jgi:hypothetical protein